jgi:hypothetical protein
LKHLQRNWQQALLVLCDSSSNCLQISEGNFCVADLSSCPSRAQFVCINEIWKLGGICEPIKEGVTCRYRSWTKPDTCLTGGLKCVDGKCRYAGKGEACTQGMTESAINPLCRSGLKCVKKKTGWTSKWKCEVEMRSVEENNSQRIPNFGEYPEYGRIGT